MLLHHWATHHHHTKSTSSALMCLRTYGDWADGSRTSDFCTARTERCFGTLTQVRCATRRTYDEKLARARYTFPPADVKNALYSSYAIIRLVGPESKAFDSFKWFRSTLQCYLEDVSKPYCKLKLKLNLMYQINTPHVFRVVAVNELHVENGPN